MSGSADKIITRLKSQYPKAKIYLKFNNPIQLLVATILSAQTTDAQVNKVTEKLFINYKSLEDFAGQIPSKFAKQIHSLGLYQVKAKNIINATKMIRDNFKSKLPDTIEGLVSLPGVGRKTANIVLFNVFRKACGVAVDTHVKRLSLRLGLTKETNPNKIEGDLIGQFSKKYWNDINILFIAHGRRVCKAKNPKCDQCFLARNCLYFNS